MSFSYWEPFNLGYVGTLIIHDVKHLWKILPISSDGKGLMNMHVSGAGIFRRTEILHKNPEDNLCMIWSLLTSFPFLQTKLRVVVKFFMVPPSLHMALTVRYCSIRWPSPCTAGPEVTSPRLAYVSSSCSWVTLSLSSLAVCKLFTPLSIWTFWGTCT